jgi:hypothetical protein
MARLEKANAGLESELKEIKEQLRTLKQIKVPKQKAAAAKKRGRKPRTMLQIIEAEMQKKSDKTMKVTEIVKMLKQKNYQSKAKNVYMSVSASLNNNGRFEKNGRGAYKLAGETAPAPTKKTADAPARKTTAKKKAAAKKKAGAKAKPAAKKKTVAKVKPAAKKKAVGKSAAGK